MKTKRKLKPPVIVDRKMNERAFNMARAEGVGFFVNVSKSTWHEHGIKYSTAGYIGRRRPSRIPGRRVMYRVRVIPKQEVKPCTT